MKTWIIFTFLYAILNGFFQCSKKKSAEKNSIYEVLACFSLIAFLLTALTVTDAFDVKPIYLGIVFLKSLVIVLAWLLGLYAINKMPISLYGVINLSRIIFSIIMSIAFLGEKLTITTFMGMIIVICGLILVNKVSNEKDNKETSLWILIILLISCLLNSVSGIIDKKILQYISSSQLQFWFLLFLTSIYWIILLVRKQKIDFKTIKKNYWIPIAAICLTAGDRLLFMANAIPDSQVSVMTIIKQFSAIEIIILGKILFKEKNITRKLLCSILIIIGIVLTLI